MEKPVRKDVDDLGGDSYEGGGPEVGGRAGGSTGKPHGAWEVLVFRLVQELGKNAGLASTCREVAAEAIRRVPSPLGGRDRREFQATRAMQNLAEKGVVSILDGKIWINPQENAS
jgi:hypothetical protein